MKIQLPFLLPLLALFTPASTAPVTNPVFSIDFILLSPGGADHTYQVDFMKTSDEDRKAHCWGVIETSPSGEQNMTCYNYDNAGLGNPNGDNLSKELWVRIQQPDDRMPAKSGFNVLFNWSGLTSRINFSGFEINDQRIWKQGDWTKDSNGKQYAFNGPYRLDAMP